MRSFNLLQKSITDQRATTQRPKIQQLQLAGIAALETVGPSSKEAPQHPLTATLEPSSYYWRRNRHRFTCTYTGRSLGFPFFSNEVEYILSRFDGRRSAISDAEFWQIAQKATKICSAPLKARGKPK